ncbi:uncharacterized protein [Amphiura filiformis]|uniref:uncharacterized protein n=1 Tax=Amphiura filiformis TaxID=82378 RepID=UPI003B214370
MSTEKSTVEGVDKSGYIGDHTQETQKDGKKSPIDLAIDQKPQGIGVETSERVDKSGYIGDHIQKTQNDGKKSPIILAIEQKPQGIGVETSERVDKSGYIGDHIQKTQNDGKKSPIILAIEQKPQEVQEEPSVMPKQKYEESSKTTQTSQETALGQLHISRTKAQAQSAVIDSKGGIIKVHNTGVTIKIPKGAISSGESVKISASVHWDNRYHPPLGAHDFIISPVIHIEAEGYQFKKPVQTTLPHSVVNLDKKHLRVFTRSSNGQNDQWRILWPPQKMDSKHSEEATVLIEGNSVYIQDYHFCDFVAIWKGATNWLQNAFAHAWHEPPPFLDMLILVCMDRGDLKKQDVHIIIQVVKAGVEAQNVLEELEQGGALECAPQTQYKLSLKDENTTNMSFQVDSVFPTGAWNSANQEVEIIPYTSLQHGNSGSRTVLSFLRQVQNAKHITGTVKVKRPDLITTLHFSSDWRSAQHERETPVSCDESLTNNSTRHPQNLRRNGTGQRGSPQQNIRQASNWL